MWFKNISIYRLTKPIEDQQDKLQALLEAHSFNPCNAQQRDSFGWVAPLPTSPELLVFAQQHYQLLSLKHQQRVLPAAVINEKLAEKVQKIQSDEARKISRKERTQLKDDIVFELTPQAFTKSKTLQGYIDHKEQLLIINSAAASQCETFINTLRDALGSLSVIPLSGNNTPISTMTHWLSGKAQTSSFILGGECELRDLSDNGMIKCKNQNLFDDDIQAHLNAGLQVTQLAVTWQDNIECLIDDKLAIRRIKFTESFTTDNDTSGETEAFDQDFALMTSTFKALISDIIEVFK